MELESIPVELKLDEENVLTFEVLIEGEAQGVPVYRFVCEDDPMSFSFTGHRSEEGVQFVIPPLQGKLREGLYDAHLEVIVENKLFIPMQIKTSFEVATRVVAESVKVTSKASTAARTAPITAAAKLLKVSDNKPAKVTVKKETVTESQQKGTTLRQLYEQKKQRG